MGQIYWEGFAELELAWRLTFKSSKAGKTMSTKGRIERAVSTHVLGSSRRTEQNSNAHSPRAAKSG